VIPLLVQLAATLAAGLFVTWRDAARIGMAALFLFTSLAHFSRLKNDMAAMIPPPLTGALWVIYVTGILEFAGAVGLLVPSLSRLAGWCLIALLVAMFPANAYAALRSVKLGGRPATPLIYRTPLQIFWIAVLWWATAPVVRGVRL
jgi:uncharacterized membrane protein